MWDGRLSLKTKYLNDWLDGWMDGTAAVLFQITRSPEFNTLAYAYTQILNISEECGMNNLVRLSID